MKKLSISLMALLMTNAHAFDPICLDPKEVSAHKLKKVIQSKEDYGSNQLIVYSVNPPKPINWDSPKTAFKSIFNNSFIKEGYDVEEYDYERGYIKRKVPIATHFIGHMFVELSCSGMPSILTGMSSSGKEEISGLMFKGKSFTQIVTTTKGFFNTSKELREEINIRREKVGNLYSMGINLRPDSCQELLKYLTEFKACGVNNRYGGLDASPHNGEGAGCSAFAMSFLQRLNIIPMIEQIKEGEFGSEFIRSIHVPKIMLQQKDKEAEVGAWGLLKGNDVPWAKPGKGRTVTFFDPEKFSKWVKEFTPDKKTPGLIYRGRDGNKNSSSIWFEEIPKDIPPSLFNLDYLLLR